MYCCGCELPVVVEGQGSRQQQPAATQSFTPDRQALAARRSQEPLAAGTRQLAAAAASPGATLQSKADASVQSGSGALPTAPSAMTAASSAAPAVDQVLKDTETALLLKLGQVCACPSWLLSRQRCLLTSKDALGCINGGVAVMHNTLQGQCCIKAGILSVIRLLLTNYQAWATCFCCQPAAICAKHAPLAYRRPPSC